MPDFGVLIGLIRCIINSPDSAKGRMQLPENRYRIIEIRSIRGVGKVIIKQDFLLFRHC